MERLSEYPPMASPFRLFSLYDFFSVFIPGLATLIGFYMLLPRPEHISIVAAVIPVLVLAFVFGQALHSFADFTEDAIGKLGIAPRHRTMFAKKISEPDQPEKRIVAVFKKECESLFSDPSLIDDGDDGPGDEDWEALYTIIQSYINCSEVGRSRKLQAIYAFSRSMAVLLFGLPIVYLVHYYFRTVSIVDRPPKYLKFFPTFGDFIEVSLPLCWLGAILFTYSRYTYRQYFIQYLISDFVSIRDGED